MPKALTPHAHHRTYPRRRLLLALGALPLLAASLAACASDMRYTPAPGPVHMQVVDRETGQPLTVYEQGTRRYVAGTPGARYALRVSNHTASRVLVVLAVDGVNVLTGQTAGSGQTGYVLDPGSSHDITGWRKSDSAVAAFEFAALRDAYAARTGRPGHVGVIGMAAFFERPAPPQISKQISREATPMAPQSMGAAESASTATAQPPGLPAPASTQDADRSESATRRQRADAPAPSAALAARPFEKLGTAHGQREYSVVTRTHFERQSNTPNLVMEVAYDSRDNLIAAGVIPAPSRQARAFPLDEPLRYVPDPPRY